MDTVSDTDRIAAAEAYIDALVSHDASGVPLADGCTRIEAASRLGSREITYAAVLIEDRSTGSSLALPTASFSRKR